MPNAEPTTRDIMNHLGDMMDFLQENMVTKDELHEELQQIRSDFTATIDHLVKDYDTNKTEHYAFQNRLNRHENQLDDITKYINTSH